MKSYLSAIGLVVYLLIGCSCSLNIAPRYSQKTLSDIIESSDRFERIKITDLIAYDSAEAARIGHKKWVLSGFVETPEDYAQLYDALDRNQFLDAIYLSVDIETRQVENSYETKHLTEDHILRYSANIPFGGAAYLDIKNGITWSGTPGRNPYRKDFIIMVSKAERGKAVYVSLDFDSEAITLKAPPVWEREKESYKTSSFSYPVDSGGIVYFSVTFYIKDDPQKYELRGQYRVESGVVKMSARANGTIAGD